MMKIHHHHHHKHQQQAPHTVSTINPYPEKGDVRHLGHGRMNNNLSHTDYPIMVSHTTRKLFLFGGNDESKKMQKYDLKSNVLNGLSVSPLKMSIRSSLGLYLLPGPKVFESDWYKGSTGSSSISQNVAFVSSESTSSTNDVSTAYGVSTSSGYSSQRENS
ncbi:hypothetical protein Tco_0560656 [Tanacetum coccineum]